MVSILYLLKRNEKELEKRRGGGGHSSGGHSSGSGRSSSSGGSSSSGSSSSSNRGSTGSTSGEKGTGSSSTNGQKGSPPAYSPPSSPPPYSPYSANGHYYGGSRAVPQSSPPGLTSAPGASILGGGAPRTIPAGTPFAGRNFGGGTRGDIYGGRGYGGGYGNQYTTGGSAARGAVVGGAAGLGFGAVAGMGMPYGYWPLYWGHGYYGDDEYGPHSNSSRPGGSLMVASLSLNSLNNTTPPQYLIYGDSASIGNVTSALTANCSAVMVVPAAAVGSDGTYTSANATSGDTSAPLLPPLNPEDVLSYYRSSSFALFSYFDDHTADPDATANFTLPANTDTNNTYHYPAASRDTKFESCLNSTIAGALPIEEGSYKEYTSAANRVGAKVDGQMAVLAALGVGCMVGGGRWQMMLLLMAVAVALQA
ncbi:hypothetical protein JCM11641_002451 [Rhodosporidiobolus odoratus]